MSIIRTVLGDIEPEALGACYAHEHVIINRSYTTQVFPDLLLDSAEKAAAELADFKREGGGAMVDTMPLDAGRDIRKLAEVSRRSGVHILAVTGLHLPRFYPEGHWRFRLGIEELAELFAAEVERGIDANDGAGPFVAQTPHRAGVIKAASGPGPLGPRELPTWEAAVSAHRRTGAPILTHTEADAGVFGQIDFLRGRGVDLRRVVLSHTDKNPDPGFHREILQSGVFVEYDRTFRGRLDRENPTLRLAARMIADFPDQVMLGTDGARASYWRSYGGRPGLDFLLKDFSQWLRETGLPDDLLRKAWVENPARAFSISR
jgi:phosphotriesterase-related protein